MITEESTIPTGVIIPLWACSHLENRELSYSGRAHCVRWVAELYQKTSLVLSRQFDWAPEAFTCPVPQVDWTFVYQLPEAFTRPTAFWPGRLDF